MLNHYRLIAFVFLITAVYSCRHKNNYIPIEDLFKIPEKTAFKISPDGDYISYLKPYKSRQNLIIRSLRDGSERLATSFADYPVRGDYFWTFNNEIGFFQDNIAKNEIGLFILDVSTLKLRNILTEPKVRMALISRNKAEPDVITIRMNKRDPANFDIYRLNIKSGELKPYLINTGNLTSWYPDNDGKIRLVKASDGVNENILYRPDDGKPFKVIIANNFKTTVYPIAFTGEKNYFYALSNVNRDKIALVEINAEDGKEIKPIYACVHADIQNVEYSKNKRRLELVSWELPDPKKHFIDKWAADIYKRLTTELKGTEVNITDRDTAENKFIVYTYTDRNPGSYYLYDKKSNKLGKLGDINTSLNDAQLCAMKPVTYKSGDGTIINGYLTLPKGAKKTDLPVIVMPHDGPFNQSFTWVYSPDVQFFANRGYAVLQVNFRGSTGYGKAFHSAGFKEVGGKIQGDITDGVKWLITNKTANPKKVAIYGGGFGGFSALYGLSFEKGLYKCAIVQHPLINFFTYIKDAPPYFKPSVKMMYDMVGNPETDAGSLKAISPVFNSEHIKQPVIIFQGAKDDRANISELNQFVRELIKQNGAGNVRYFLKPNERAIFRNEQNKIEMYAGIEKFLNENMPANP